MKILVDMTLSPRWCAALERYGHSCRHWSAVGGARVSDATMLRWAQENAHVVLTQDLEVGAILAATRGRGLSVVQCKAKDVLPEALGPFVARVLQAHEEALAGGAILVADPQTNRVRILPLTA